MNHGPRPSCECGACKTCRARETNRKYYNSEHGRAVSLAKAERWRKRKKSGAPPVRTVSISDAELDERCLRWLEAR